MEKLQKEEAAPVTVGRDASRLQRRRMEEAKSYLDGYRLCREMLQLRQYEKQKAKAFEEDSAGGALILGSEAGWRARMYEIAAAVDSMKNGHEKLVLYYRYIRGESVEHISEILGVSRRTGYRWHDKGLLLFYSLLKQNEKRSSGF